ncbi:MAG: glycerol-3-phosphate acyltransferase, partial [Rhizomicrobium sp.]
AWALFGPGGAYIAGLGAIVGHIFPVWLKFRGGKGVATTLGVMLAVCWPAGLAMLVTWLVMALLFRISSLAALVAALMAPAYAIGFGEFSAALLGLIMAVVIVATHHENIGRLWRGVEPRIGRRIEKA